MSLGTHVPVQVTLGAEPAATWVTGIRPHACVCAHVHFEIVRVSGEVDTSVAPVHGYRRKLPATGGFPKACGGFASAVTVDDVTTQSALRVESVVTPRTGEQRLVAVCLQVDCEIARVLSKVRAVRAHV